MPKESSAAVMPNASSSGMAKKKCDRELDTRSREVKRRYLLNDLTQVHYCIRAPPMPKKSKAEAELSYKARRLAILTDAFTRITCTAFHCAALVAIFYCMFLAVESLAGKSTTAQFLLRAMTDLKVNRWVPYLFGGGALVYGYNERRLRKKTVARLQERNRTLEKELDLRRSTSGLPASGDTRSSDAP